jgi:hypothetical protein
MAKSVAMFGTALPMKAARRLMHVPFIMGFHALGTGLHWKIQTKMKAKVQRTTMVPIVHAAILKLLREKILQYMMRMATLMSAMLIIYKGSSAKRSLEPCQH